MATNFYFNNFGSSQEQLLIENLIIESIKIYGMDMYYLPKTIVAEDALYGEAPASEFNTNYGIEMYIKNVEGFEGEGDFLSKFNLEIKDRVTFTVARRTFQDEVGNFEAMVRPNEGDLIFFPLNNKVFEIKFVEHEAIFYQMGSLQTFDIVCELFEYQNQKLNTGIPEVDAYYEQYSSSLATDALLTENGIIITDEEGFPIALAETQVSSANVASDNAIIQTESDEFIDFSEIDPFAERPY